MTEHIIARRANSKAEDREWSAWLKGATIKLPRIGIQSSQADEPEMSPEKDKKALRMTQKALARKQKELQGGRRANN